MEQRAKQRGQLWRHFREKAGREFLRSLAKSVLRDLNDSPKSATAPIWRSVKGHLPRVPGFREQSEPVKMGPALVGPLSDLILKKAEPTRLVMNFWLARQTQTVTRVAEFLRSKGMTVTPEPSFQPWVKKVWRFGEAIELARDFAGSEDAQEHQRLSFILLASILQGRAPVPDSEFDEVVASLESARHNDRSPTIFSAWLSELEAMDVDDSTLGVFDDFAERARATLSHKLTCNTDLTNDANALLSALHSAHGELLTFLGHASTLVPDIGQGSPPVNQEQLASLRSYCDYIAAYSHERSRAASNIAEERERRDRLARLELELNQSLSQLAPRFQARVTVEDTDTTTDPRDPFPAPNAAAPLAPIEPPRLAAEQEEPSEAGSPSLLDLSSPSSHGNADETARDATLAVPKAEETASAEPPVMPLAAKETPDAPTTGSVARPPSFASISREAETPMIHATESEAPPVPSLRTLPVVMASRHLSTREAATAVVSEPSPEAYANLVAALLRQGDVSGAYWIVSALSDTVSFNVSAELLALVQGAEWITHQHHPLDGDLLRLVQRVSPDSLGEADSILAVSAALVASLINPQGGSFGLLGVPCATVPSLHNLVSPVQHFCKTGLALDETVLSMAVGVEVRDQGHAAIVESATRWLEDAQRKGTGYQKATALWTGLVRPSGDIYRLMAPVAQDARDSSDKVREILAGLSDPTAVSNHIKSWYASRFPKARKLVGGALNSLALQTIRATEIANAWLASLSRRASLNDQGGRLRQMVSDLRRDIRDSVPDVCGQVAAGLAASAPSPFVGPLACLGRTVLRLCRLLSIQEPTALTSLTPAPIELRYPDGQTLEVALSRRLLLTSGIRLDDGCRLAGESEDTVPLALARSLVDEITPLQALRRQIDEADFRWFDDVSSSYSAESGEILAEQPHFQAERLRAQTRLEALLRRVESLVEQCSLDGILTEDRARFHDVLATVEPLAVLDVGSAIRKLQDTEAELDCKRRLFVEELRGRWPSLAAAAQQAGMPDTKIEAMGERLKDSFTKCDTRVATELFARLQNAMDEGSELEDSAHDNQSGPSHLTEFLRVQEAIKDWLSSCPSLRSVAEGIRKKKTRLNLNLGQLSQKRLNEAKDAIDAWAQLKTTPPTDGKVNEGAIREIFRFLGYAAALQGEAKVALKKCGAHWAHLTVEVAPGNLARPIPQLGSQLHSQCDVLCLWERPGAVTIGSQLDAIKLGAGSVAVVLYLGRLGISQRRDLIRVSRSHELVAAVLDELLLVYMAHLDDARLPAFISSALPFTAADPFVPFRAGDVPAEMFFGRKELVRSLRDISGSCVVFGGRQLGKSALLTEVERRFNDPSREQYSWVCPIKPLGAPVTGHQPEAIWGRIRDDFKKRGLLPAKVSTDSPDKIRDYVLEAMKEKPERRVLILFDEADNFLDADARGSSTAGVEPFKTIEGFRTLMAATERRFKVVFAGLHNVQRFQGMPNQPLAHFGTPLCVGPLEGRAARDLIKEPFESLGYAFDDEVTLLKILSYTNYHPGLIQYFCQELLKRLRRISGQQVPPFTVRRTDVDAVYRDADVRARIVERFNITLALDQRYQAIVWSLIEDQVSRERAKQTAYQPLEILTLVQLWWPAGFQDVDTDQLRGLLDELRGLGVLARDASGHYRLRSPNLVPLVGSVDDIEQRLLELEKVQAPSVFDADSHHHVLSVEENLFSPLTYAQERDLTKREDGLCLVFSSRLLGGDLLCRCIEGLGSRNDQEAPGRVFFNVPPSAATAKAFRPWLEAASGQSPSWESLVAVCSIERMPRSQLYALVGTAAGFLRSRRSRKRWMRLVFVFGTSSTVSWLSGPVGARVELENPAAAVMSPRPWNEAGVRQRLDLSERTSAPNVLNDVLDVTGGWPLLLDELDRRMGRRDDPREFLPRLRDDLAKPDGPLIAELRHSSGLEDSPAALQIAKTIARFKTLEAELIQPDLIDGGQPMSQEECQSSLELLERLRIVRRILDKDGSAMLHVAPPFNDLVVKW